MYEPRPYGLHAVGGELTEDDSAAVELLARRLTNLKNISQVNSLRLIRALPDGGYAIAQDMGGMFRVITHKPRPSFPPTFSGIAQEHIPMLFSGVITKAIVRSGEGVGIKLSEASRLRIASYDKDAIPSKQVYLNRFSIEYNHMFAEFLPESSGPFTYTQYVAQRPTWYSGAMAELMQIVGGYGRQDLSELPDEEIERSRFIVPSPYAEKIKAQLGNVRLPGYSGSPPSDGKFQIDYKFESSHGIGFDTQSRPWVLRIDRTGVWAMPLPIIPATTTEAFRDYVESVGDDELLAIVDRFGGMPSGEGMPINGINFQAWRRAGVIVKVCDVSDFYHHSPYATTCGWSFNSTGTEGYNTGYEYNESTGLGYGVAYKFKVKLSPAENDGKLPPAMNLEDPVEAARLDQYMGSLYELLAGNDHKSLAIKYKLRRVSIEEILSRAANDVGESEVEYWDALELDPIATHTGSVSQVAKGDLYSRIPAKFQPQIKFPEPFLGGCVSHDFSPLIEAGPSGPNPRCDTIMFGYYIGDQLKTIKYFYDPRSFTAEVESDFEGCMIVGSWQETRTTGSSGLVGNFYTADIDERKELAPIVTVTTIEGKDLGYDSRPAFSFDDFFHKPGSLWRSRYYSHKAVTTRSDGRSLAVAVCIPFLCRNAVLHAKIEGITGGSKGETLTMHAVRDPTSYRYWTYDFIFAWAGGLSKMTGVPYPKDGSPVWVELEEYSPDACSDFADQGSWIPGLPADYTWLIHPNKNQWLHSGGGGSPAFNGYSRSEPIEAESKGEIKLSIFDAPEPVGVEPHSTYFLKSPDDVVGVFYRDACRALFGTTTYANVSESHGGLRKYWGNSSLATHDAAHHFIGVINE